MIKKKFEFESFEGYCDAYVNGQKVKDCHNARHGHVYLHFEPEKVAFEIKAHDPRIPVVPSEEVPKETPKETLRETPKKQQ